MTNPRNIVGWVLVLHLCLQCTAAATTLLQGDGSSSSINGSRLRTNKYSKHFQPTTMTTRTLQDNYFQNNVDVSEVSLCGCNSCYDREYEKRADGSQSCAKRINGLMAAAFLSEEDACRRITSQDDECAAICDIDRCDGRDALFLTREGDGTSRQKTFCGCETCTADVWLSMAGVYSCGARISYLTDFQGKTEEQACAQVGAVEFPAVCLPCDPATCPKALNPNTDLGVPTTVDNSPTTTTTSTTFTSGTNYQGGKNSIPLTPDFPLYCFPDYNKRTRYENVWGKYLVEVKESDIACGPSDNIFSSNSVQVQNDELTLQFKNNGGQWQTGEVRVLLPQEEMPFHYGEYAFSVKSIQVIDTTTGEIVDTTLPVTMILGLFTWDSTEDYATHENYNHEVDIEIARWDNEDLADVQFLVQPPGDPHKYRFFSGLSGPQGNTYHQAPHTHKFAWKPSSISWHSSSGGGQSFTYSTQDALNAGQPDYTQCMPADVEVRLNLWNLYGSTTPKGMEDTYMVEVVIDDFHYTPSGLTALADGGTCSKDCQCGSSSLCKANKCTYVGPDANSSYGENNVQDSSSTKPESYYNGDASSITFTTSGISPTSSTSSSSTSSSSGEAGVAVAQQGNENDQQSDGDSRGGGGLKRAGKTMLVLCFLIAAAVIGYLLVRNKRDKIDRFQMLSFRETGSPKKVVVECWEEDTANESSFEMSLKNGVSSRSTTQS